MKSAVVIALALCFSCAFALDLLNLTPIAERGPSRYGRWNIEREAYPAEDITFKILIKQRNLEQLEKTFWEVSDPRHENYGKFLTTQEVKSMIAPAPAAIKSVVEWLMASGIPSSDVILFSDYVQVSTSVAHASKLFSTSFSLYRSSKTGSARLRITGFAHIPTELVEVVDFVAGISELIDDSRHRPVEHVRADDDQLITPAILKAYYGIPLNQTGTSDSNLQGIAAFSDYFSYGALQEFDSYFKIDAVNVTREGPDCLNDSCDQYESDLDVQYVTSIGLGVPTVFLAHGDGEWILDWAQQVSNMQNPPLVNSISYGWPELDQCAITTDCNSFGYNSSQYVDRTDTELMSLGSMGVTVMVSDGDDGAPSLYGASGNCPMDPSIYCPTGGCNHTSSACNEITFTADYNDTLCFFPMGLGTDACQLILGNQTSQDALSAWGQQQSSDCELAIEQDYDGMYHFYSSCDCSELTSYSSYGFTIAPYTFDQSNGPVFTAEWPTSSPYVTSVGATQFTWDGNSVDEEIGASITTGARITTGGGFSTFQPQPSYQAAAVQTWIQNGDELPPSFAFNPKMRAYPDVAFNGHNYVIFASNNTADLDQCPCMSLPVDGTSCSSPAFAGLISLINDQLLNQGKSPLGFLNMALYQVAASNSAAFTDIVDGSNACNRAYCCTYGYEATTGWDPVSGLGSPVFSELSNSLLSLKGVRKN